MDFTEIPVVVQAPNREACFAEAARLAVRMVAEKRRVTVIAADFDEAAELKRLLGQDDRGLGVQPRGAVPTAGAGLAGCC